MNASNSSTLPYTDTQRREAADWFVIIHAEIDPNSESTQAWLKWMDQHEGNRAAFDSVAQAWHATPGSSAFQMPGAEDLLADDYDGEQSVEEWLRDRPAEQGTQMQAANAGAQVNRPRTRHRAWLIAASVLIAVVGLSITQWRLNLTDPHPDEFTTTTGEQIEITLADGSHVWLGPRSTLTVAFNKVRRDVELTRGEAFFAVKKDPARPFTVQSAGGDIVAVGTAFNVRAVDEQVIVDVSEGVVAVTPRAQRATPQPASVHVATGQQLTFTARQTIAALSVIESAPGERARWRDGVLVYRDESLQAVVSDVVRYSEVQIEIADAAVGDLRYSGVIYQDAVHEWISALPESFPVTIVSNGSREIIEAR